MTWDLEIGQEDSRTAIHSRHGGSTARGISAPAQSSARDNILLWWRPEHGESFGYLDGWTTDGTAFYFTGTGQRGDQRFESPNAENGRVRDHLTNGEHIRLLRYVSKNRVRYVTDLRLDSVDPWQWIDGLDSTMRTRRMIQFRFLAVDTIVVPIADRVRPPVATSAEPEILPGMPPAPVATDVEALSTKQFKRLFKARESLADRAEAILVHEFQAWLVHQHGLSATGLRIPYAAEGRNLRADLFITDPRVLVEAKATTARESIRMAIGQLLDYQRWMSPKPCSLLLTPDQPPPDMRDLLDSLSIAHAWREGAGDFSVAATATWLPA